MALREPLQRIGLAFVLVVGIGTLGMADEEGRVQQAVVLDNCDPATFNEVGGPGTCLNVTGGQGVAFPAFLEALPAGHPQWLFYPAMLSINRGDTVRAVNQGGEIHTFTEKLL